MPGMGKIWTPPLCKSEGFSTSLLTGVLGFGVTASFVTRSQTEHQTGVLNSGLLDGKEVGEGACSANVVHAQFSVFNYCIY